jgi:hypothetical protein
MATDRLILCGPVSATSPPVRDAHPVALDIYSRTGNVNLRLEKVRSALWADIPATLRDLLDVAVYVYSADQATTRANGGRVDGDEIGAGWRRRLHFRIAVREPDRWDALRARLVAVLSFLTEDEYHFEFVPLRRDCSLKDYIDFEETPYDGHIQEVALFSGGVDSLAGAVQEVRVEHRNVLLVNHRSTSKRVPRYDALVRGLNDRAGRRPPLHFSVWANKHKSLGREHTQRSRSFLFAALGSMFAHMIGLNRVRFYENGVVSLNLPLSAQVVGARASRTTHPRVLHEFGELLTALLERRFTFENPFLWHTKTDVVELLLRENCADLLASSMSCGHTWELTQQHTHCGVCSQCLDRRLAVVAAGLAAHDPVSAYKTDPLAGEAPDVSAKTMMVAYMELVERVEAMTPADFLGRFGEVARVLRHHTGGADEAAQRVFRLYKKHAQQVRTAIDRATAERIAAVTRRTLPRDCLLRLVYEGGCAEPAPDESVQPARPSGNYFIRRGDYWAVRFGAGEENLYQAMRGFDYLRILLEHPRTQFSSGDLLARVRRQQLVTEPRGVTVADAVAAGVGVTVGAESDTTVDRRSVAEQLVRLRQIEEDRARAAAGDSPTRLDEIEDLDAEERTIRARLARDLGLRGHARGLGDLMNRLRNQVCNAVRRALEQIEKYDKALAKHLSDPVLTSGHSLLYQPDSAVAWSFDG